MIQHAPACPFGTAPCTCGAPTPRERKVAEPLPPADITDEQIADLAKTCEAITQRRTRLGRVGAFPVWEQMPNAPEYVQIVRDERIKRDSINVVQRCLCCGADVVSYVADHGTYKDVVDAIGAQIRIAYARHRCELLAPSLFGATYDELEQMRAELEREGTRMIERAAEIERMLKAQARGV